MSRSLQAAVVVCALLTGCGEREPAVPAPDSIFLGEFVTRGTENSVAEAVAVRDGIIVAVGTRADIEATAGPATEVVEIPGVAVPGWIDGHVHIAGFGQQLANLNVQSMTRDELVAAVGEAAARAAPGEWIVGGGWDEGFFDVPEYPRASDLDPVAPDNPVFLGRIDGHSALVNSRALEMAGIDGDTTDPRGGQVLRDAEGSATGMLIEQAQGLVTAVMPDTSTPAYIEEYVRAAMEQYRRWGLTGVHDAGASLAEIRVLKALAEKDELPVRVYAMAAGEEAVAYYLNNGPETGLHGDRLTIRSFKIMIDGALGARGAELSEPYSDAPETSGLAQMSDEEIDAFIAAARAAGMQVNGHVIGDLGVERLLDAIERAGVPAAERFRLEHASMISPDNLPRFAKLGVIASMQPVFIGEYQRWSADRVGPDRVTWILPIGELLASGARLAVGTDYPASDSGDPRTTLNGLVNRTGFDGKPAGGWYPAQAVDVETALDAMSMGSAYAAFAEDRLGAITVGRYADFTVLGADPRAVPRADLLGIEVRMTVVGGEITYRRDEQE